MRENETEPMYQCAYCREPFTHDKLYSHVQYHCPLRPDHPHEHKAGTTA